MATARTKETQDSATAQPIDATKRKVGRPRTRGIEPAPATTAGSIPETTERTRAAISGAELDADTSLEFFDLLQAYDPSEWSTGGLIAYLYRTAPVIDRGRTGQEYNLQKFTRAFDVDEIMKSAYGGSGGYKVLLRRFNGKTRHTDAIRDHFFRILNYEYPPRIPAGDWLDNENNREWQWAKPKLEAIARAEAAAQNTPAAAGGSSEVMDLVRSLLPAAKKDEAARIADEVVQAIQREQPKTSAGLESIVLRLLDRDNQDGGAVAALRIEVAAARQRADDLMMRMLDRATAPPPAAVAPLSLAAQLKELLDVKEAVGTLFGRGGKPGEGKLDWQQVGIHVADKLFDAAPGILQAIAMGKAGIKQPTRHAAATPGAPALPAGEQPIVESPEEVREMIAKISNQFGPMFDEVTPFLSNYFARGVSGMHFRDWLIEEYGRRTYDGLRQLHPQTIVDVIELRKTEAPENLRGQLALLTPAPKLLEFVEQFLSDFAAEYDDDIEQTAAAPAAPAPVPNGAARVGGF